MLTVRHFLLCLVVLADVYPEVNFSVWNPLVSVNECLIVVRRPRYSQYTVLNSPLPDADIIVLFVCEWGKIEVFLPCRVLIWY